VPGEYAGDVTKPPDAMLSDHRRALRVSAILLACTAFLFVAVWIPATRGAVQRLDEAIYRATQSLRSPPLTFLAKAFDLAGGVYVTTPIRIGVTLWLSFRRRWAALATWILTWVGVEVALTLSKALYDRGRPPASLVPTSGASFPSGHAGATAATAVALVIVLLPPGRLRLRWELYAMIISLVMAASRVYLNAHWTSDVVAAVLLGTMIAIGSAALVSEARTLWSRRRGRGKTPSSEAAPDPP
jgi:membrane-associated phospholipid phosphatase